MILLFCSITGIALLICVFFQQASFGQSPRGERRERILKSTNYKDGAFQNQLPTKVRAENASFFRFMKEFMKSHPNTRPNGVFAIDSLQLPTQTDTATTVQWLGHSSFFIQCDQTRILVDPVFSQYASPVQFAGVKRFDGSQPFTIHSFSAIDIIIITHDHYDHLDYNTILAFKDSATQFVTPLGVGQHLERWGIDAGRIHELDWWESYQATQTICLTATPSRHFSGRGTSQNQTLWASFVLQSANKQIFMSGDSGFGPHFAEIGKLFGGFDLALIESGQFNDLWPNIHLHPHQSVQAAIDLHTKALLPIHWAKFKLAMHPWNGPINEIITLAKKESLLVTSPRIGQAVVLDKELPQNRWFNDSLMLSHN